MRQTGPPDVEHAPVPTAIPEAVQRCLDWLFAEEDGAVRCRLGARQWPDHIGLGDVAKALATLPDRTLRAVATAPDRRVQGMALSVTARQVYDWLPGYAAGSAAGRVLRDHRGPCTELDEEPLALVRAQVLLNILLALPWDLEAAQWYGGPPDPELMALLARHIDRPGWIAATVHERRTLDLSVLGPILDSPASALSEGSL